MSQPTCSEADCPDGATCRGLCGKHYAQRNRAGTLPPRVTAQQRFWLSVNKDGPLPRLRPELGSCWLWTGDDNGAGYGRFGIGRRRHYVHRLAFMWAHGREALAPRQDVDHMCHVRRCVRPSHLRAASRKQNNENHQGAPNRNNRSSQYRGVTWNKRERRWLAQAMHNGKNYIAGRFVDEGEAGEAAAQLRRKLFSRNDADRSVR